MLSFVFWCGDLDAVMEAVRGVRRRDRRRDLGAGPVLAAYPKFWTVCLRASKKRCSIFLDGTPRYRLCKFRRTEILQSLYEIVQNPAGLFF